MHCVENFCCLSTVSTVRKLRNSTEIEVVVSKKRALSGSINTEDW